MKSYDELKAEMEAIQQQMVEAKKNERANALKEVKRLCKDFGFNAGICLLYTSPSPRDGLLSRMPSSA